MFGACISGLPVTIATEVSPLKYTIQFINIKRSLQHFCIFLLPEIQFDPNYTALVYYQVASAKVQDLSETPEFKLFGGLNLNKPSAVYKLNTPSGPSMLNPDEDLVDVTIGISIEPNEAAAIELAKINYSGAKQEMSTALVENPHKQMVSAANKIIGKAYNYLAGFADANNRVDIAKFNDWWVKFIERFESDPNYLNRD